MGWLRSQGEQYRPTRRSSARHASTNSPTTSACPPRHGVEATEWSVVSVGHRQKPSWCFAVRTMARKPASRATRAHCRGSKRSGRKMAGSSVPSPHSRSVKVFTPKWRKSASSSCCQRSWEGDGRGRAWRDGSRSPGRARPTPVPSPAQRLQPRPPGNGPPAASPPRRAADAVRKVRRSGAGVPESSSRCFISCSPSLRSVLSDGCPSTSARS